MPIFRGGLCGSVEHAKIIMIFQCVMQHAQPPHPRDQSTRILESVGNITLSELKIRVYRRTYTAPLIWLRLLLMTAGSAA
jgi:hypothetical protein